MVVKKLNQLESAQKIRASRNMSNACTPILLGVASPVQRYCYFENGQNSLSDHELTVHGLKIKLLNRQKINASNF